MFHRIIVLLLIVTSLFCNFNRCAVCFQSFSEHCLQEYSKRLAYQTLLKITSSITHRYEKLVIVDTTATLVLYIVGQ